MPAIYPPEATRRDPQRAPGVPDFKSKDSVLRRPDGDPASPKTVAPGTLRLRGGRRDARGGGAKAAPSTQHRAPSTYSVTWWDPRALALGAASSFGLRRDDLIVKDGDMFAVEDRLADYEKWRDERATVIDAGARPTVRIQTATAWAAEAAKLGIDEAILELPIPPKGGNYTDATIEAPAASTNPVVSAFRRNIDIIQIPGAEKRPRGPRFGTLVHAVLATVPLDAADEVIARTAQTQARIIDAPAAEVTAAAVVVSAVLRHQLIARARASTSVKRETPVSWVQKDGTLIEGVLDLAFDEDEATVVVDFKTDHELAAGEIALSRPVAAIRQRRRARDGTRGVGRALQGVRSAD